MKRILLLLAIILSFTGCSKKDDSVSKSETQSKNSFVIDSYKNEPIKIASGSENKELEGIIEEFAKENKQNIEIEYMGSLDMVRELENEDIGYDAIWPASSIWIDLADSKVKLKHEKTISISPVVFAINKDLSDKLGFSNKEVKTSDLIEAIRDGNLKFMMTNASRSNSGASFYLGVLTALSEDKKTLTDADLDNENLKKDMKSLLEGVSRSSGSSNWLVDLFLEGGYDAMVNYEALAIKTNNELIKEGKDPLQIIYPSDGLSISDSPLVYIDKGDKEKEERFLKLQDYLLSDKGQDEIEKTGKRSAYGKVSEKNADVFNPKWGIDIDRPLNPIRFPKKDVIKKALSLYQKELKKKSMTVFVLDYSASMTGNGGYDQMLESLKQIFTKEAASRSMLLSNPDDINIIIPFGTEVLGIEKVSGDYDKLEEVYDRLASKYKANGSTYMFEALEKAIETINSYDKKTLDEYNPSIVLLSDGKANGQLSFSDLKSYYENLARDIPIFSITYGRADEHDLKELAKMSKARVFDGKTDMQKAFLEVKGYN